MVEVIISGSPTHFITYVLMQLGSWWLLLWLIKLFPLTSPHWCPVGQVERPYFTASVPFPVFLEEVISLNGTFQQVPLKRVQLKQVMLIMHSASHIREPRSTKSETHTHARTHAYTPLPAFVLHFVRSDGAETVRETWQPLKSSRPVACHPLSLTSHLSPSHSVCTREPPLLFP